MTRRNILPKTEEMEIRITSAKSPPPHPTLSLFNSNKIKAHGISSSTEDDENFWEFMKFQKKGGTPVSKLNIGSISGDRLPFSRLRLNHWYSNDEIFKILSECASNLDSDWLSDEVLKHPLNGSVFLFDRRRVKKFKKDSFIWKRRKTGGANSIREDRMSLKANGTDCLYACYTHSALMPTFHRRCYWLQEKPDIVLVHYLQTPNSETGECSFNFNSNPITNNVEEQPTNESDLATEIKAMLWPFYLDKSLCSDNAHDLVEVIAARLLPRNENYLNKQHIRVNLMSYMNLSTEQILSKFASESLFSKSNLIVLDSVRLSSDPRRIELNLDANNNNNNYSAQSSSFLTTQIMHCPNIGDTPAKASQVALGVKKDTISHDNSNDHVQLSINSCNSSVSPEAFLLTIL